MASSTMNTDDKASSLLMIGVVIHAYVIGVWMLLHAVSNLFQQWGDEYQLQLEPHVGKRKIYIPHCFMFSSVLKLLASTENSF